MITAILTGAETSGNALTKILDAIGSVMKLSGDMLDYMTDNPIYAALLAVGFIGIGISVFQTIRGAARG